MTPAAMAEPVKRWRQVWHQKAENKTQEGLEQTTERTNNLRVAPGNVTFRGREVWKGVKQAAV